MSQSESAARLSLNKDKSRRWIQIALSLGVAAIVVVIMWQSIVNNLDVLSAHPLTIDWLVLAVSFVVYLIDLALAIWAWHLIVRRLLGIDDWRRNSRVYIDTLLARRLPGSFWHIVGRAKIYAEDGVPKTISSIGGALEFVIFFLSGAVLYLFLWFLLRVEQLTVWTLLCLLPLVGIILFPGAINRISSRIARVPIPWILKRRDIITWVVVYIAVWFVGGILLYFVIASFYPLPLSYLPETISVWTLASMVGMIAVFTPAGLGIRELTMSSLLILFVPAPYNVIAAIVMRVITTLFDFFSVGLVYLCLKLLVSGDK